MGSYGRSKRARHSARAVLLAWVVLVPVAGAVGETPHPITSEAGLFAASDGAVAWTRTVHDRVDLLVSDITSGTPTLVTSVTQAGRPPTIHSLTFQGTHLAWIDDRFGAGDVFVIDLSTGAQKRMTSTPATERGVALTEDLLAWGDPSHVWLHAFANGTTWDIPVEGTVDAVALWEERPVWIQVSEGNRTLMMQDASGRTRIDGGEGWFIHDPVAHGSTLAWQAWHTQRGVTGIAGFQLRMKAGQDDAMNLTALLPGPMQGPWVAHGRVAWLESGVTRTLHVREQDGGIQVVETLGTRGALSSTHVVLQSEHGGLKAFSLAEGDGKDAPGLGLPGACLLVLGSLLAARRRRAP